MPASSQDNFKPNAAPFASISPPVVYVQSGRRQPVLWIIAGLLAVIAAALIVQRNEPMPFFPAALAQTAGLPKPGLEGARGIYAFTGQLNARSYGLFMLDVDTGTVWCYEIQGAGTKGEPRLKLVAARSWVYDRYLEEFNTGEPIPTEVREMVQQQRLNRATGSRPAGTGPDNAPPAKIERQ